MAIGSLDARQPDEIRPVAEVGRGGDRAVDTNVNLNQAFLHVPSC
jgi:hypothetical protein